MNKETNSQRTFPAKVLLIGEYGIVTGGSGLAVPYPGFSGWLEINSTTPDDPEFLQSANYISRFVTYLKTQKSDFNFLDFDQLHNDVATGLWFSSTIPTGYGLGSSGALVAAVYSSYRTVFSNDPSTVKSHLAQMESFFHGASSGVDPSVSFFQKPLLVSTGGTISALDNWTLNDLGLTVFLVDTGVSAKTGLLVDWFHAKMMQKEFRNRTGEDYLRTNQSIIETVKHGDRISISDLQTISRYQLEYFTPMVPESFRKHFQAGLKNGNFAFKLCGSGGGGFMLCFAAEAKMATDYLRAEHLSFIELTHDN